MPSMTTPDALAVLDAAAEHYLPTESDGGTTEADMREARAHLASRIAELEMEAAGATAAYERFTAYTITHNGAMRYCSSDMRDAYAEMSARATRAEAELAAVLNFLRDDSLAATFQTLGQYRTAAIDAAREGK